MYDNLSEYNETAQKVLSFILARQNIKILNVDGRAGGYLTSLDHQGLVNFSIKIGNPNYNKAEKYLKFSIEKARRLFENIEESGHKTSYESMNEEEFKFPGAIHLYTPVLSFSGFPALIDEALCFVVKLIICQSSSRQDFHEEILEIYKKRENSDGLNIYIEIQKNFYSHLETI